MRLEGQGKALATGGVREECPCHGGDCPHHSLERDRLSQEPGPYRLQSLCGSLHLITPCSQSIPSICPSCTFSFHSSQIQTHSTRFQNKPPGSRVQSWVKHPGPLHHHLCKRPRRACCSPPSQTLARRHLTVTHCKSCPECLEVATPFPRG